MKPATLLVETHTEGKDTKIIYQPGDVNPYVMIGVFRQMIREIETQNAVTEKRSNIPE